MTFEVFNCYKTRQREEANNFCTKYTTAYKLPYEKLLIFKKIYDAFLRGMRYWKKAFL